MISHHRLIRLCTLGTRCQSSATNGSVQPFEAIPGPRPLPVVGNIWRYLPLVGDYNINELYDNAKFNRQKYGPIVREQITKNHTILHLFDTQDVEAFFRQDGAEPHRRSHRALLKLRRSNPSRYNDGGIFPENGPSWARLRGLFHQYLMKKPTIELRSSILDDMTRDSIESLRKDGRQQSSPSGLVIEDFTKFLQTWTIKCALAVFLDHTRTSMPERPVLESLLESLDNLLAAIAGTEIRSEKWTTQPDRCPYFKQLARAEDFTYQLVEQRIEQLLRDATLFNEVSFIRDWLLRDKIDRKDVITFVLDCLLASVHTTAYTTTFLLENISRRLDGNSRERLQKELQDRMPPKTESIQRDIFADIPILKDCLRETERLHPVSIGTGRLTQHEMTIRNYQIPRGVMVIAQNQLIARDPSHYQDPGEYCPARWSNYRSLGRAQRPSRFAWLPFGFGPRACPGQRLVNLQMQIFASRLLQDYDIEFLDQEIKTKTSLVHCLDGKIKVKLRARI